jgi:hypothetical protein
LGLAPTPSGPRVVQRGSRRPLGKRFRWWGLSGLEPGDLILIRVLHRGLFPQDHPCDLGKRCTAGDRYKPLGSDGMWTKCGPICAAPAAGWDGSSAEGRLLLSVSMGLTDKGRHADATVM